MPHRRGTSQQQGTMQQRGAAQRKQVPLPGKCRLAQLLLLGLVFAVLFVLGGCANADKKNAGAVGVGGSAEALGRPNPVHSGSFVTRAELYEYVRLFEQSSLRQSALAQGNAEPVAPESEAASGQISESDMILDTKSTSAQTPASETTPGGDPEIEAAQTTVLTRGRIVGVVSPHHLTAGKMIAGVIAGLAAQSPRVIIIVGPNHENAGAQSITGYYAWPAPDGVVKTEAEFVRALITSGQAEIGEEILAREHSIGSIVPFIKHYLPETNIVPLILHHGVTLKQVDALLAVLEPYLGDDVVLLASVDFSHYLSRREAYERDEITLRAMREWDYPKLFNLTSEYLDSPASLSLVFRAAQRAGIDRFELLEHSNAGDILHTELLETTSYFTLRLVKE